MEAVSASVVARVTGRVQGVGFRDWTRREAEALLLRGWVRNEPDGSVTAVLAGSQEAVAAMIDRLRQGPPGAKVRQVATEPADPTDTSGGFHILR